METVKKAKILYVLKILREQTDDTNGISLPEILVQLEKNGITAERKSVYDDINILIEFGFPIEKRKSRRFLYHYTAQKLTGLQADMLSDAVLFAPFISSEQNEAIRKAIPDVFTSLSPAVITRNEDLSSEKLQFVYEAVRKSACITFKKSAWVAPKKKKGAHKAEYADEVVTMLPQKILWTDRQPDAVGILLPDEVICSFSIMEMRDLEYTNVPFTGTINAADYIEKIYETPGKIVQEISIECVKEKFQEVMGEFFADSKDVTVKYGKNDIRITGKTAVDESFYNTLFEFGDTVKLASPKTMADIYRAKVKRINKVYKA